MNISVSQIISREEEEEAVPESRVRSQGETVCIESEVDVLLKSTGIRGVLIGNIF